MLAIKFDDSERKRSAQAGWFGVLRRWYAGIMGDTRQREHALIKMLLAHPSINVNARDYVSFFFFSYSTFLT